MVLRSLTAASRLAYRIGSVENILQHAKRFLSCLQACLPLYDTGMAITMLIVRQHPEGVLLQICKFPQYVPAHGWAAMKPEEELVGPSLEKLRDYLEGFGFSRMPDEMVGPMGPDFIEIWAGEINYGEIPS